MAVFCDRFLNNKDLLKTYFLRNWQENFPHIPMIINTHQIPDVKDSNVFPFFTQKTDLNEKTILEIIEKAKSRLPKQQRTM